MSSLTIFLLFVYAVLLTRVNFVALVLAASAFAKRPEGEKQPSKLHKWIVSIVLVVLTLAELAGAVGIHFMVEHH